MTAHDVMTDLMHQYPVIAEGEIRRGALWLRIEGLEPEATADAVDEVMRAVVMRTPARWTGGSYIGAGVRAGVRVHVAGHLAVGVGSALGRPPHRATALATTFEQLPTLTGDETR